MEDLTSVIKKYIARATINQALLVNGDWGSGKTYFFKEKAAKILDRKIIYLSLYGVEKSEDLFSQIVVQKYSLLGKVTSSSTGRISAGILKSLTSFGLEKIGLSKLQGINIQDFISFEENEILIIDDIERRHKDLDIENFLGFVNTNFTEHNGIKVILVCDENVLVNRLENEQEKARYFIIKEKVVWRSVLFQQKMEEVLPSIISSYEQTDGDFHSMLRDVENYLLLMLATTKFTNLRWLEFYFEILREIYGSVPLEIFDKLRLHLTMTSLVLTREYKSGNMQSIQSEDGDLAYLKLLVPSKKYGPVPINNHSEGFSRFDNYYIHLEPIAILIRDGTLRNDRLVSLLEGMLQTKDEESEWNICLDAIRNFRQLTQDELQENYTKCLQFVEEGRYDVQSLISILNFSTYFIENRFVTNFRKVERLIAFLCKHAHKASVSMTSHDNRLLEIDSKKIDKYPAIRDLTAIFQEKYRSFDESLYQDEANLIIDKWIRDPNEITRGAAAYSIVGASYPKLTELAKAYGEIPTFADKFYYKISMDQQTIKERYQSDEHSSRKFNYLIKKIKRHIADDKVKLKILEEAFKTAEISVS